MDVSLADAGYSYTEIPITSYTGGGGLIGRGDFSGAPPNRAYPCKNGWIFVTAGDQHQWPRICSALDKPEWLEDERFNKRQRRVENQEAIDTAIKELLATMTVKEGMQHFTFHDVTVAPVNDIPQAAADPHPWERRSLVEVPDPIAGTINVSGDFWHVSRTPTTVGTTPMPGEHTDAILAELLEYNQQRIDQLREENVIG